MTFGIDYVTMPPISAMKAAGVTFVCRYLSYVNNLTQVKLLTTTEAKALSDAGIEIVSNYEWYANRALESAASGVQDAHIAASQHAACGGTASRPIYFSVDADVAGSQVADYFRGVASVIGKARTGAYGSYRVLKYLFDMGLISYGWQTYAWSGGQWESRAHIQQYQNGMTLGGASVDYDRSIKSDFGQWRIGGTMSGVPQGWRDQDGVLYSPSHIQGGPEIPVTGPFRDYVLANAWRPTDRFIEIGHHVDKLEYSNESLGSGWRQQSLYSILEKPDSGPLAGKVLYGWQGVEALYLRNAYEAVQAEIAQLKAQPAGLDAGKVAERLKAISLLLQQATQLTTQAIV